VGVLVLVAVLVGVDVGGGGIVIKKIKNFVEVKTEVGMLVFYIVGMGVVVRKRVGLMVGVGGKVANKS
jgi:hypothetical protein